MTEDNEGFLRPLIDDSRCVSCGKCVSACSEMASTRICNHPQKIFAAINNNEAVRLKSSSGGIFSAIAQDFIRQSGVVVGAQFASDFSVEHVIADTLEWIEKIQTSKYVQSNTEEVFPLIKELLLRGKKVLFTGTPCQVAALHFYLPKTFDNLFCIDFICHGVPSPGLWRQYLEEIQRERKSGIVSINFRDKRWSWNRFSLSIRFKNGTEHCKPIDKDPFLKIFLSNIALRPSCYCCNYRGYNRYADITLADFWSVRHHPDIPFDQKGISMVILNNRRADEIMSNIKERITIWDLPNTEETLKENPCFFLNPETSIKRNDFFNACKDKTIKDVASVFIKYKLSQRIRIELSSGIKRIKDFF